MMRYEKNGYVVEINENRYKISNKHGVHETGTINGDIENTNFHKKLYLHFVKNHTVSIAPVMSSQKRVALNEKNEFIQLQAFIEKDSWFIQEYDNELMYIRSVYAGEIGKCNIQEKMKEMYNVQNGLMADVFKSSFGDCTNHGISENEKELYIITDKGPFPATDIRKCVAVEKIQTRYGEYVRFRPVYEPNNMYAAGGNFLYTSDCRFKEITGIEYPVPIHDQRVELF